MNTEIIAGLYRGDPYYGPSRMLDSEVAPTQNDGSGTIFKKLNSTGDGIELSRRAQESYKILGVEPKPGHNFEANFMDALAKFTQHALQINGILEPVNGKHAYLALHVLADKSGVQIPGDLIEGKEEALDIFKKAWALDDLASADDIYEKMVRVFGEDTSFGFPKPSAGPGVGEPPPMEPPVNDLSPLKPSAQLSIATSPDAHPMEEAPAPGTSEDLPPISRRPDNEAFSSNEEGPEPGWEHDFREAIEDFTLQLFKQAGMEKEPTDGELHWVLSQLYQKLDLSGNPKEMAADVFQALGMHEGATVEEIVAAMARAYRI